MSRQKSTGGQNYGSENCILRRDLSRNVNRCKRKLKREWASMMVMPQAHLPRLTPVSGVLPLPSDQPCCTAPVSFHPDPRWREDQPMPSSSPPSPNSSQCPVCTMGQMPSQNSPSLKSCPKETGGHNKMIVLIKEVFEVICRQKQYY